MRRSARRGRYDAMPGATGAEDDHPTLNVESTYSGSCVLLTGATGERSAFIFMSSIREEDRERGCGEATILQENNNSERNNLDVTFS